MSMTPTWMLEMAHRYASAPAVGRGTVPRGAVGVVRSGRKVPLGTVGVLVCVVQGDYGPRAGLFLATGVWVWTSADNVAVFSPANDGERDMVEDLRVAWSVAETERAARTAALLKGQPALKGTPRQRKWAEQIRQSALLKNRISPEEAKTITSSREWIDRRYALTGR